jgi:hypothetical protein
VEMGRPADEPYSLESFQTVAAAPTYARVTPALVNGGIDGSGFDRVAAPNVREPAL